MKVCTKCGEGKELSLFYKQAAASDGYGAQCKACQSAYGRARHATSAGDAKRARERLRRTKYKQLPEKVRAASAVKRAVARGEMAPASACECQDCRKPAQHLHHHSYEKQHQLDVVPLCARCHMKRHADGLVAQ